LKAAGIPVTNIVAQNEDTDPNSFLGRPGQYTERVSFDLPGGDETSEKYDTARGGVIEVWKNHAAATKRADYIQSLRTGGLLGTEYDYVKAGVLLRIEGLIKPSLAKKINDEFQGTAVLPD